MEWSVEDKPSNFGATGDIPVSGDWDNDGLTEIGVFRPSTHTFYLDVNGNGVWNGASVDNAYKFGATGDIPVSGDWNNDGLPRSVYSDRPRTCSTWMSTGMACGTERTVDSL